MHLSPTTDGRLDLLPVVGTSYKFQGKHKPTVTVDPGCNYGSGQFVGVGFRRRNFLWIFYKILLVDQRRNKKKCLYRKNKNIEKEKRKEKRRLKEGYGKGKLWLLAEE